MQGVGGRRRRENMQKLLLTDDRPEGKLSARRALRRDHSRHIAQELIANKFTFLGLFYMCFLNPSKTMDVGARFHHR